MSPAAIQAFADRFALALMVEFICSDGLPAWYRKALFRQEMATKSNADAERFLERVIDRVADDDPLAALLGWAS